MNRKKLRTVLALTALAGFTMFPVAVHHHWPNPWPGVLGIVTGLVFFGAIEAGRGA